MRPRRLAPVLPLVMNTAAACSGGSHANVSSLKAVSGMGGIWVHSLTRPGSTRRNRQKRR